MEIVASGKVNKYQIIREMMERGKEGRRRLI